MRKQSAVLICLFCMVSVGAHAAPPVPKKLDIPADHVPKEAKGGTQYFMGFSGFKGTPINKMSGVYPIYVASNPTKRLRGNPFQKGDLIVGIDGVGLGEEPIQEYRKALGESRGPKGDYKITVARWRKGTITTFDFNIPRPKEAAPPLDFTKGQKPKSMSWKGIYNIGPTGITGWVETGRARTKMSRQILITAVDKGSPADGILAKDDVILGADGKGTKGTPAKFTADARICFADAVNDAEARSPATLRLLRWRPLSQGASSVASAGKTDVVTLKLETLGAYSDTAPYNCPKSRVLLRKGVDAMVKGDNPGRYGWGILPLLASDDPTDPNNDRNQAKAKEWAHRLIVPEDKPLVPGGRAAFPHGFKLIILGEYYLKTRDQALLPTLRAYAELFAKHQSRFGTTGHGYAAPAPDGSTNGSIDAYGALGMSGTHGLLGLSLAQKAGVRSASIDAAIRRSEIFFSSYAFKSTIPYGEHEYYYAAGDSNGKCSGASLALQLRNVRPKESRYFAKIGVVTTHNREVSHAGPFFNAVWPQLAAASLGKKAANHYFKRTRWNYDLYRRWDHRVSNHGPSAGKYRAFSQEVTTLLAYALPLRQLYVTGRGQDKARWLSDAELKEVVDAEYLTYDVSKRDQAGLEKDLSSWAPYVRRAAAAEMARRAEERDAPKELLTNMHALARDTDAPHLTRAAACSVLGKMKDHTSVPLLVELLQDKKSFVRFWAAKALRAMDQEAVRPHLNTILRAAVSNVRPVFPLTIDDPLQFAHCEIGKLLFNRGGVLYKSIEGVDRALLWPAVRALAKTPTGQGRSPVGNLYKRLGAEEVLLMADTIVESVRVKSPADSMFSGHIRSAGIDALERNGLAEGAHLAVDTPLHRGHQYVILRKYGPAALEWDAAGRIAGNLSHKIVTAGWSGPKDIPSTLNTLLDDSKKPRALTSLKRIEAVTATSPELRLPTQKTELKVKGRNYALGDEKETTYTWRKVYGTGTVRFAPNASWDSKETSVTFTDGKPGKYRFEVTMSDSLGYTTVKETVDVTVLDRNGKLPSNRPPRAHSKKITATPGIPVAITLGGSDPERDDLAFAIKGKPAHGTLFGAAPNVRYIADWGYTGADTFTFEVLDGQGVSATGTVRVDVKPRKIGLTVYEGFDYKPGLLNGLSGTSEIGLQGTWKAKTGKMTPVAGAKGYTTLPTVGSVAVIGSGRGGTMATRSLDTAALKRDGLLADGKELWFSARVALGPRYNGTNDSLSFGLMDGSGKSKACVNFAYGPNADAFAIKRTRWAQQRFVKGRPHLVVVRCRWGKTDAESDTVSLFRVMDLSNRGPTLVEKPVGTFAGNVDQSKLDTLFLAIRSQFLVDEIRIGPSYHSVLLGTVPMDKADVVQK